MYLSRLAIDASRLDAVRLLSSPHRIHAAVEAAFADDAVKQDEHGRILWRIDVSAQDGSTWLYVLSPEAPDLSHIAEQAGFQANPDWTAKDYDPLLDKVHDGMKCQFRLKANPARKVLKDQGRRENAAVIGSVQGHVTEAQQKQWLLDRAASHGFQILKDDDGYEQVVVSRRKKEKFARGGSKVTLATAQYDGMLAITDADLFRRSLGFGIGRAKGYGCGLITIIPMTSCHN